MVDFTISEHGTIVLIRPESESAQQWANENIEATPSWGGAYWCDHRPAQVLVDALVAEGFALQAA